MNKVITINLNGVAFQLEEGGYDALRAYLDLAARRLEGNPDKGEILADIEQAIADRFRALLGAYKTVVNTQEVAAVLEAMGPVEGEGSGATGASASSAQAGASSASSSSTSSTQAAAGETPGGMPRRLFRITDGAMVGGVCNGLAAYVNLDVTLVRLAFALLTLVWGTGILVYLVLLAIMPAARTSAEKAAAAGGAATAQEFIRRAREGYYAGMRAFPDRHARREWRRQFRHEMRAWRYGFHQSMHQSGTAWTPGGATPVPPPPAFPALFLAPVLGVIRFGLLVGLFYGIYQLAKHGAVFGLALPPHLPLWVGIFLLVLAYVIVSGPIKWMRYACYYPRPPGWGGPLGGFLGSLLSLFFIGFGVWLLDRHWPEFHAWLTQLPDLLRSAADAFQGWLTK